MEFDFNTNGTVDKIDAVPEKYRPLYTEVTEGDDAGKFTVADQFKGIVADYVGTAKSLGSARADKKKASDESAQRRQALKSYEDILESLDLDEDSRTAEGLRNRISDLMDAAKNGKELKINLEKMKREYENKQTEAIAGKDKEIGKLRGDLHRTKVSDVATREIASAKGSVDLLLPIVERHCKVIEDDGKYVVRIIDADGDARSDGAGGWMGVKDLVAELKTSDSYARAFDSDTKTGVGSPPGSSQKISKAAASTLGQQGDKSSIDKIRSGLNKGLAQSGSGSV